MPSTGSSTKPFGNGWGGLHSARIVLYSVDFLVIERLQQASDWVEAGQVLARAARAAAAWALGEEGE